MHSALRALGVRRLVEDESASLVGSLVLAELFYKFHSFLLECVAFLATWYVLGGAFRLVRAVLRREHRTAPSIR